MFASENSGKYGLILGFYIIQFNSYIFIVLLSNKGAQGV